MYCKECGKHIADDSKFCSYCGTKHENNLANNGDQTIKANKFVQICSKCNTKETPLFNSNNEICGSVCLKCNTDVINGKCPNCHRSFKNYKDVSCSYCGSSWKSEESKIVKLPTNKFTEFPPIREDASLKCPKCGSANISANKKGFSFGKALVGGILTGGVGLLAGTIGSSKIKITCLACGKVFKPGE